MDEGRCNCHKILAVREHMKNKDNLSDVIGTSEEEKETNVKSDESILDKFRVVPKEDDFEELAEGVFIPTASDDAKEDSVTDEEVKMFEENSDGDVFVVEDIKEESSVEEVVGGLTDNEPLKVELEEDIFQLPDAEEIADKQEVEEEPVPKEDDVEGEAVENLPQSTPDEESDVEFLEDEQDEELQDISPPDEDTTEDAEVQPKVKAKEVGFKKRVKSLTISTLMALVVFIGIMLILIYSNKWFNPKDVPPPIKPTPIENAQEEEVVEKALQQGQDAQTEELTHIITPIFKEFGGKVESVEKDIDRIVIKGDVGPYGLMELNEMVRRVQIESYPYLIETLSQTEVVLNQKGTKFRYLTKDSTIHFITRLNYEDRHSSQIWWEQSIVTRNGINMKADINNENIYLADKMIFFPKIVSFEGKEDLPEVEEEVDDSPRPAEDIAKPNEQQPNPFEENSTSTNADTKTPEVSDSGVKYKTVELSKGVMFDAPETWELKETQSNGVTVHETEKKTPYGVRISLREKSGDLTTDLYKKMEGEFLKRNKDVSKFLEASEDISFYGDKLISGTYIKTTSMDEYIVYYGVTVVDNTLVEFEIYATEEYRFSGEVMRKTFTSKKFFETNKTDHAFVGDTASKTYVPTKSEKGVSIDKDKAIFFQSEQEAISAGYKKP